MVVGKMEAGCFKIVSATKEKEMRRRRIGRSSV